MTSTRMRMTGPRERCFPVERMGIYGDLAMWLGV